MTVTVIIAAALALAFCMYAFCVAAGKADQEAERMWMEEHSDD